ncbi:hypothetical protein [Kribbella italica]|uniref:Secreted protein n=1 Tax=Kribbella italica TaxID=1540520 RepID=A0A7W9J7G7_9ACTN|nr:hypothetical protein [Kribbella italica]MBB5836918.1 hypothetical protein [Kribbella italica]
MKRTLLIPTLCLTGALVVAGGATAALAGTGSSGPAVLTAAEVDQQLAAAPAATTPAAADPVKAHGGPVNTVIGGSKSASTVAAYCRADKMTNVSFAARPGWKRTGALEPVTIDVLGKQRSAVAATHVKGTEREQLAVYCVGNAASTASRVPGGDWLVKPTHGLVDRADDGRRVLRRVTPRDELHRVTPRDEPHRVTGTK